MTSPSPSATTEATAPTLGHQKVLITDSALDQLKANGFMIENPPTDHQPIRRDVTPAGCDALSRLVVARRERLEELFVERPQSARKDVASVLRKLARELAPEPHPTSSL